MDDTNKFPAIIELNVGGQHFTTSLMTLTKCPDNMLASMFSGNYSTVRDNGGRYFIDTDGSHFIYILNFLRYGDLPPSSCADIVYREAVYFGIQDLVKELERYPCILGKIQRNNFRSNFPGYQDCLESIIKTVSDTPARTTTSDVKVLLFATEFRPEDNTEFDLNHTCVLKLLGTDLFYLADTKLGPWSKPCTEKEILSCILYDLQSKGFTLTAKYAGQCDYVSNDDQCRKQFYSLCFHWWKR